MGNYDKLWILSSSDKPIGATANIHFMVPNHCSWRVYGSSMI